jgi:hypothetical protein
MRSTAFSGLGFGSAQATSMDLNISYRATREGLQWRWQLLSSGVVILQGIAISHATAVAQVADEISGICTAVGERETPQNGR